MLGSTREVEFRGVPFEWGRHTIIVPPLDFGQTEEFAQTLDLAALPDTDYRQRISLMTVAIHAAMTRNYPLMGLEHAKLIITGENVGEMFQQVLGRSRKDKVAVVPPGERPAVVPGGQTSTGPASAAE